jgi:hypothetical protein
MRVTRRPTYIHIAQFEPEAFGGINSRQFTAALSAEGIPCSAGNPPMHRYDLFQLTEENSFTYHHFKDKLDFASMSYPVAEKANQTTIWTSQQLFLGGNDLIDCFMEAVEKIRTNASELKNYEA